MKKGLTQTLLTVAIALLGYQALAMAPVISEIPSPVIGNQDATAPNVYVWPDAIALDDYVTPQTEGSTKADIKWYYQVESPGHYKLNGVEPLTAQEGAATDATTFPSGKRIDNQVVSPELNPDGVAKTVTIRNNFLSPLDGSAAGTVTGDDSEVITLFAADGTAYETKEVIFYTEVGGTDHLYSATPTPFVTNTFATTDGWVYNTYSWGAGVTSARSSNTALCFNITTPTQAYADWVSPMGLFTVEQNSVYKIRANLNGSQTTKGHTPFWDLYVSNFNGSQGLNLFGGDLLILDNGPAGSADSVIQTSGGTDFQMWFAPICIGTAQWNTNFAAANTGNNLKAFVGFRVMDIRTDLGSDTLTGQLCLNELDITRYPISAATTVGSNLYSRSSDFAPNTGSNGNTAYDALIGTTVSWTGGVMTLTPTSGSAAVELANVTPATDTNYHLGQNDIGDNFPVTWESDTLYRVTYTLAAPSDTAAGNPFDAIYIGVDTPSNEVLYEAYVTNQGTNMLAMPKATAATYQAFWWSHKVSTSTAPYYNHFRPRLTVINNGSLVVGNNTGGVKVSACTVSKVSFN